ncbi:MAG TPA: MarR family transcriptional regulator [Chthoniobacterales bacterium]|nr:MarR family transcriptional regulator [Chthoniobacterales bacterium]
MSQIDPEIFGPLLHGTARAWRLKLDERLKPMGLSQAKWRTLLHLSIAPEALTQTEIAERLGIEEPTLVTLLHRLEREGWVKRANAAHDRRCKLVLLGRRAQSVISHINAAADELRHELLADVAASELQTCIDVLTRIRARAEKRDKARPNGLGAGASAGNGEKSNGQRITKQRERWPSAGGAK